MGIFVWQDNLKLGNTIVDEQHRHLFKLANTLVNSEDTADLSENAMLLFKHVREHFKSEEIFMKDHNYPDYQKHVETHNHMLDMLVDLSEKINQHQWQRDDVLAFMQGWISHIVKEDAAINSYFARKTETQKSQ